MKLRTQRVHQMGSSNRDKEFPTFATQNVFETSYIKSKSSYYKTAQSLPSASFAQQQGKTSQPFKGSNVELETVRWNSVAKRRGKDAQWRLQAPVPQLDYTSHLNEDVKSITAEFKGKNINLYKINQLKHTFVKNNKNRRNLKEYFSKFEKEGKIGVDQLQEVVGEYGYDINQDEAKIIFRLTGSQKDEITLNQFVDLMARQNVHFSTLKLDGSFGKPQQHFTEKIHLVFKNKFNQLKEAFKIYRTRDEPIDKEKYDYVMKKLDINDLVVSKEERQQMFDQFKNKKGFFNAEALFSAIIEQHNIERPIFPPRLSNFDTNLKTQDELQAKQAQKNTNFDMRRTSNLQFQHQFSRAQQVLQEVRKLGSEVKTIIGRNKILTKDELLFETENLLKSKGINFTKQDYDCYGSYFDYNNTKKITEKQFNAFLSQTPQKAEARFDRRLRALAPLSVEQPQESSYFDENSALESLKRVRNVNMDTETKKVFSDFDKDKDGFVSRTEFKNKLKEMAVLENWQVDNLANYFDSEAKGYVNYAQFAKKFDNNAEKTDLNYYVSEPISKLKSHSEWLNTKKTFIKDANTQAWNVPTKYSAWPQRLRHTDMSLIQPPSKAGQFISESQRFNSNEKHEVGQQHKQQRLRLYQNKVRKLAAWNDVLQQRIQSKDEVFEKRCQANDYSLRLTKEIYEENCRQGQ